ncbi:hypothetical protein ACFV6W_16660, partial [Streptomyces sp. NPDC059802]
MPSCAFCCAAAPTPARAARLTRAQLQAAFERAVAGALGVPLGVVLHGWAIPARGDSAGLRFPASVIAVHHATELFPLALGGLLIATLGALLPADWAARARTATALRTEVGGRVQNSCRPTCTAWSGA